MKQDGQSQIESTDPIPSRDRLVEISDALGSAIRHLKEQAAQDGLEKNTDRKWHRAEVIGLWVAAVVAIGAVCFSYKGSHEQRLVMERQLNEMEAEQRPNFWFGTNLGAPVFIENPSTPGLGQIIWTVHLTNWGRTLFKVARIESL